MYEPTEDTNHTPTQAMMAGGAVIYDSDLSSSPPCYMQTLTANQLVSRMGSHKTAHVRRLRDDEVKEGTPMNRLPSFLAMKTLAVILRQLQM